MKKEIVINWFRQDLRILDNPSLSYVSKKSIPVLNIFILDEINSSKKKIGSASKVWLYHSLKSLNDVLDQKLFCFKGCAIDIFRYLSEEYHIREVVWNRCYEPWRISRDTRLKLILKEKGISVHTFNGSLLWEPWTILKDDKTPYKVFTPYYRKKCLSSEEPRRPIDKPKINHIKDFSKKNTVDSLSLLPDSNWTTRIVKNWEINHTGLNKIITNFFKSGILNYKLGRNFPDKSNVSKLSPYIHWGLISPNILWYECEKFESKFGANENIDHFKSELGWREFSYYLLYHFPGLPKQNLQVKFDKFPWIENNEYLKKWQNGSTGYPIIDAGMRQLWETGYMHNRIRMLVGSFLVKNLMIDWRHGEKWFWDCLFDADLASNSASWQWVAGTGADAAPYFRIFNPITQGQKFDNEGNYTKKYVPELANLPLKFLYNPWDAPSDLLEKAGVKLGVNYPKPIINLKESRATALEAFASIRNSRDE